MAEKPQLESLTETENRQLDKLFLDLAESFEEAISRLIEEREVLDESFTRVLCAAVRTACLIDDEDVQELIATGRTARRRRERDMNASSR